MYAYSFVLKKAGFGEWDLYSEKGIKIHTFTRCGSPHDVMEQARAWASSWSSVSIRFEDEQYDEDKKRD